MTDDPQETLKEIKQLSADIHKLRTGKFGSYKKALELQKHILKRKGLQNSLPPLKLVST